MFNLPVPVIKEHELNKLNNKKNQLAQAETDLTNCKLTQKSKKRGLEHLIKILKSDIQKIETLLKN